MTISMKYLKTFFPAFFLLCAFLLLSTTVYAETQSRKGFLLEASAGAGVSLIGEQVLFNLSGGFTIGAGVTENLILGLITRMALFPFQIGTLFHDIYLDNDHSLEELCLFFLFPVLLPFFTHTLIGIECTYFISDSIPSLFIRGACGFSFWPDPLIRDIGIGIGALAGIGYEFSRLHKLACEVMYSLGEGPQSQEQSQAISIMVSYTIRFF